LEGREQVEDPEDHPENMVETQDFETVSGGDLLRDTSF
jgi:hypothetical protein